MPAARALRQASRPKRTRAARIMSTSAAPLTLPADIDTVHDAYSAGRPRPRPITDYEMYKADETLNSRVAIWRGELGRPTKLIAHTMKLTAGDITKLQADMIVNAANASLLGGGGVDGAIHRAAGPQLLKECRTLNGARTGETKVTHGYDLPATWVAHTVGPIYSKHDDDLCRVLLRRCYKSCLAACAGKGGGTIAFPAVSTGIYGFPIGPATHIALEVTREFLEANDTISKVIYVVFNDRDVLAYSTLIQTYFPPAKGVKPEAGHATDTDTSKHGRQPKTRHMTDEVAATMTAGDTTEVPAQADMATTPLEEDKEKAQ